MVAKRRSKLVLSSTVICRVGGGHRMTDDEIRRSLRREIAFLRSAALELRRIAGCAPEVADQLRRLADQLESDAEDLLKRFPGLGEA